MLELLGSQQLKRTTLFLFAVSPIFGRRKENTLSDFQQIHEESVDRREETVTTQQPGYVSTEQVIYDVAAERRQGLFQITRIIWTVQSILMILLGLRFLLKFIGANPVSGFAWFIYGITGPFVAPFTGLIGTPMSGGTILEVTTLIAMGIYVLIFWGIVSVVRIVVDRPSARIVGN
jgi:hypothetical protein